MARRSLFLVVLAALGFGAARADDPPPDGGVSAALAQLAAVDSTLSTWARTETIDSDVKRSVLDSLPLAGEVPPADPSRGLTADAAAQGVLAIAEQRLVDLEGKIHRRELELVYGATAQPEPPSPQNEIVEERFDVRSLARAGAPGTLPAFGVPLPGLPASDERLRNEELGCDPERLTDLVAAELAEEQNASVDGVDGAIAVRATAATVGRVRSSLERLAEISSRRVQVQLRAWRISRELRAELASLSPGLALSPAAEERLEREGTLLAEETLVTGDGRVARSFRTDARSYTAEVAGVASNVDTVARSLHTGVFVEALPRLDSNSETATVSVRFSLADAGAFGKARVLGMDLELPELALARTATTAVVPLGRGALVGGSFESGAETPLACVLWIKATLLPPPGPSQPIPCSPGAHAPPEKAIVALDKETKAEIARLHALVPEIERALARVRLARERHVEVLDVRDLLVADTGALSLPRLGVVLAPPPRTAAAEEDPAPSGVDAERLELLVKRSTGGDDAWAAPAWLGLGRGALLVRQTPGTLASVQAIVGSLRRERRGLVEVESCLYRTSGALANELAGVLSRDALSRLDVSVREGDASLVSGGFLVARAGERVSVLAGRERAFVAGTVPSGSGSASGLGVVRTGFRLGLRARVERGGIALELDASSAHLRDLARHEGPNGAVFEPSLELDSGVRELLLEDGAGFGLVRSRASGKATILVVRARSL